MVEITVTGHPYVKKSNQRVVYRPSIGRQVKVDTPSYKAWHQSALQQLSKLGYNPQFARENKARKAAGMPLKPALIDERVNLQCRFFVKSNGRTDLSALYEGIQDVLVEVGILSDDNWHIVASHDGSGVEKDAENPRIEITIKPKDQMYER